MRIAESLRNKIETNKSISKIYDFSCQNRIYRNYVIKKMQKGIKYIQQSKKYNFMIEVSNFCNAQCIFCPNHTMLRKKELMSDEIFHLIIKKIINENINPDIIDLFDIGEPLIDNNLFYKIRLLKENFPESKVRITTNFYLANDKIIKELLNSGLDSIHISLNASNADTYKKIMNLDYETTINNINKFIKLRNKLNKNINILVSMVLCSDNMGEEKEFVRLWKNKVDSVCLQRAINWGGKVSIKSGKNKINNNKFLFPCNDLFNRIVILSNGDMALCCQDSEGIIGKNIKDYGILEIFNSNDFKKIREIHLNHKINNFEMCKNCFGVNSNGANWLFQKYK